LLLIGIVKFSTFSKDNILLCWIKVILGSSVYIGYVYFYL